MKEGLKVIFTSQDATLLKLILCSQLRCIPWDIFVDSRLTRTRTLFFIR